MRLDIAQRTGRKHKNAHDGAKTPLPISLSPGNASGGAPMQAYSVNTVPCGVTRTLTESPSARAIACQSSSQLLPSMRTSV